MVIKQPENKQIHISVIIINVSAVTLQLKDWIKINQ